MEANKKLTGITPVIFAVSVVFSVGLIGLVKALWPSVIPFSFWGAWTVRGEFWKGTGAYWPVFLYGFLLQSGVILWKRRNLEPADETPTETFIKGCGISVWAGFTEEILYRWLGFLNAIAVTKFFNLILFGFVAWLFRAVTMPIADFTTLGQLHAILYHPAGWWVGAAMLSSNSSFRDGHKYQGFLGFTNSWFLGMVLFHCMFYHGLPVAIVVHMLYDICVFTAAAMFYPTR